jgi:hypothetical protein
LLLEWWNAATIGLRPSSLERLSLTNGDRLALAGTLLHRAVAICEVDDSGQPSSCVELGSALATQLGDPAATCVDVTAARVGALARFAKAVPGPTIVALCTTASGAALFTFDVDDDFAARQLRPVDVADTLSSGDLDGDGLDDLIAIDHRTSIPTVRIYTQCTSRQVAGCVGAGAP